MEKQSKGPRGGYLEALLTACPVPIIATDSEGIITFINKEACKLAEREMKELIGSNIADLYENLDAARETNRRIYASGGVIRDHASRVRTKSGKIINVHISASHLKDSSGNYIGAVGYFEPYRPWNLAEKQLRVQIEESEARLEECKSLSAPIFELCSGLSIAMLAGRLDSKRLEDIGREMLDHIEKKKVKFMLINLFSAEIEDDGVVAVMVKTIRTAHLLGTECLLAGVKASFARMIEPLLDNISTMHCFQSMDDALKVALNKVGYEI